jgi:hypothetical protein
MFIEGKASGDAQFLDHDLAGAIGETKITASVSGKEPYRDLRQKIRHEDLRLGAPQSPPESQPVFADRVPACLPQLRRASSRATRPGSPRATKEPAADATCPSRKWLPHSWSYQSPRRELYRLSALCPILSETITATHSFFKQSQPTSRHRHACELYHRLCQEVEPDSTIEANMELMFSYLPASRRARWQQSMSRSAFQYSEAARRRKYGNMELTLPLSRDAARLVLLEQGRPCWLALSFRKRAYARA